MMTIAGGMPRSSTAESLAPTKQMMARNDAIRLGALDGPGVATAKAPLGAIEGASSFANPILLLPPRLTLSAGRRYGDFGSGSELQATLVVDLPLRPLGRAREEAVSALKKTTLSDVDRAREDAALRAAIAWTRAVEAKAVLHLREDSLAAARTVLVVADRRLEVGVALPAEAALARGDVGTAKAAMLDAEGSLVESFAELRLSTGLSPQAPVDVVGDVVTEARADDSPIEENTALKMADIGNPLLRFAKLKASSAKADVSVVSASLSPVLGIGASVYRDGLGDRIYSGILSIPLPFVDPAGYDRSRATIAADVADADVVRIAAEVRTEVVLAIHDRAHTRELRDTLRDEAVIPLRAAFKQALVQYETGTTDVTLVLFARQRVHAVEEQLIHASAEVLRADLRYAHVVGQRLAP